MPYGGCCKDVRQSKTVALSTQIHNICCFPDSWHVCVEAMFRNSPFLAA